MNKSEDPAVVAGVQPGVNGDEESPAVLFIDRAAVFGGVERIIITAMRLVRTRGFRPILVCPGDGILPETAAREGFRVHHLPLRWMQRTKNPLKLLDYWLSLKRESREITQLCHDEGVVLLHPHNVVSALYAVDAASTLGIPLITHIHDAMPQTLYSRAAYRYVTPATTRFVSVSHASKKMLTGIGIPADRIDVVYNGVDPAFLRPACPSPAVRGKGPHIGIVALVEPIKGQDILMQAVAALLPEFPDAHLHIVGPCGHPDDAPYIGMLHKMAESSRLRGHVTFHGHQTDVPSFLEAFDLVVLATIVPEALPTAIIEAMCMGRPVVGTDVGGTSELIRGNDTCRLVPPRDVEALAGAMRDLLRTRPEPSALALSARQARERFNPDRFGDELVALYRGVLSARADVLQMTGLQRQSST
jgi:glycosyltransferase involved in cell wall biosynthesis